MACTWAMPQSPARYQLRAHGSCRSASLVFPRPNATFMAYCGHEMPCRPAIRRFCRVPAHVWSRPNRDVIGRRGLYSREPGSAGHPTGMSLTRRGRRRYPPARHQRRTQPGDRTRHRVKRCSRRAEHSDHSPKPCRGGMPGRSSGAKPGARRGGRRGTGGRWSTRQHARHPAPQPGHRAPDRRATCAACPRRSLRRALTSGTNAAAKDLSRHDATIFTLF